jgi:CheY-like chemotaxis protein
MSVTVVLAVGLVSDQLAAQKSHWRTAGFIVVPVWSIREAIEQFSEGDFDLVLLGHSLSVESKERLASLIRKTGSRTPVLSIGNSPGQYDLFADATLVNEPANLLPGIVEFMTARKRIHIQPAMPLRKAS